MTSSTDTSDRLWLVIGGPNPGIHRKSPQIACGRGSPPLPITIECLSSDEAHSLLRTLQPIVQSLPPQPSYEQILTAFDRSPAVKALFTQARNQHHFYVVVVGSPAAILHSRLGALASRGSFSHPKSMHTRSFWKALAYMIVKGIDDLMPLMPVDASDAEEDGANHSAKQHVCGSIATGILESTVS
ncbi:hypothetical protein L210DRAFT_3499641 [Boletus edulis BED1]|uniref:Uncharacterized protein n=1 Tax=Boletus edulis BED1 TaxID=1328754 RepID=A0AAD4GNJ1_BOLED|nr:hypothetical protein L210DRAFT_3499641 [Boletus edulis BED1]